MPQVLVPLNQQAVPQKLVGVLTGVYGTSPEVADYVPLGRLQSRNVNVT
jgi:hypothetical protein